MSKVIIRKSPNFDVNGHYDTEVVYTVEYSGHDIEYITNVDSPEIWCKFRIKRNPEFLGGHRTGYAYKDGIRYKLQLPTIEEILNTKNGSSKKSKINFLFRFGNYYQKEALLDNGLLPYLTKKQKKKGKAWK